MEKGFSPGPVVTGQGAMALSWKRVRLDWTHRRNFFYYEGGETLEQVSQRSCGCPLPGSVRGQPLSSLV